MWLVWFTIFLLVFLFRVFHYLYGAVSPTPPFFPCVCETLTCIHMVPIQTCADRYAQGSIVLHLLFFCSFCPVSIHILQITNLINPHFSLLFSFCPKDRDACTYSYGIFFSWHYSHSSPFFSPKKSPHQILELFLETSSYLIFLAQYSAVVPKFIPWSALRRLVGWFQ